MTRCLQKMIFDVIVHALKNASYLILTSLEAR
jgi:hypothetical protein